MMTYRNMYSSKDFENVMWGKEFYECVSPYTQSAVDYELRKEAISICNEGNIYKRRSMIKRCPEILRGYLEMEVKRIWKIKVDNSK